VLDAVDTILTTFLFPGTTPEKDLRVCPNCGNGKLGLKTGKFGAFIGCSNYPECNYTRQLVTGGETAQDTLAVSDGPKELGKDPATGLTVFMKKGPYGLYVQLGEEKKPKRASIPKTMPPESVTLESALALLALPRDVGLHPETGKMIVAGRGRFGPYLLHDEKYTSVRGDDDILTIGINRAVDLIAEAASKGGGKKTTSALRTLGNHPDDNKPVGVYEGRYGPYVKHGKTNATLPKDITPDTVTLEQALELLAARAAKGSGKGKKKKKK
jgi:DNA topoisomerase I